MGEQEHQSSDDGSADHDGAGLEALLEFIRDARGFDFTGYKRSSLARRIRKRMAEVGLESWGDYRDRLEIDADEFRLLFNTILINVTSFFRDAEAWRHLQEEVVPELVARTDPGSEIRVWSAGCSSGEEPYSVAIVLAEHLGLDEALSRVKIYGTDVDEEALHQARTGSYPLKALENMPQELRDKYFDGTGAERSLRPDLRRRVIFGRHDITRDAPISRLDLLVCRNTLMYFNVETQNLILDRLHFALNEGGYLFLGKAEMLLSDSDKFEVTNMRQRLFRRHPGVPGPDQLPPQVRMEPVTAVESRTTTRKRRVRDHLVDVTPYAVVGLDVQGMVVAVSEAARTAFGITTHDIGRPFRDLELSYRPVELRSVIEQANSERRTIRLSGIERRTAGPDSQYFDIVVRPMSGDDGLLLGTSLAFVDVTVQTRLQQEVKRIREDLETAYEELQSTNEELETTNEELQSSIEELETTNEELQSTNEELETTNEELQSGNEELETMNEEMRIRTSELDEARGFLEGVLSSIGAGVVVLDTQMLVRSWNAAAEELWGLRASEVISEPFFSLEFGLPVADLLGSVQECLSSGEACDPVELPAVNRRGQSIICAVTCTPLDGQDDAGVVLLMEAVPRPQA
ncbi:CheR family methyltransferase [Nocardioides sp. GXQ0305]|uniref:CheR family methyltransferase n=1 Tax=Nocardioides sp. GXQ0305 TaxID=3423912 RepID=UPI003D7D2B51